MKTIMKITGTILCALAILGLVAEATSTGIQVSVFIISLVVLYIGNFLLERSGAFDGEDRI